MLKMLTHLSWSYILTLMLIVSIIYPIYALYNPAAVYCTELGYVYSTVSTSEGDVGVCIFGENESANAWNFLRGKEALEKSYCTQEGYEAKYVKNIDICGDSDECTMCILQDGSEVEVTKLMDLNFEETFCGDGVCLIGEDYSSCPQDCRSGSADGYCDGVEDGICDEDCFYTAKIEDDPDCGQLNVSEGVVCGNEICENTETTKNCCKDCGCPSGESCKNNVCLESEACGNGICGKDETSETCPQDCEKPGFNFWLILIPLFLAIAALVYFIINNSRKV